MLEPVDENKWTDLTGLTDEIICEYRVCFIVSRVSWTRVITPNMFASKFSLKLWNVYFLFLFFFSNDVITFLYKSALIIIVENNSAFNIFLIRIIIWSFLNNYLIFFLSKME